MHDDYYLPEVEHDICNDCHCRPQVDIGMCELCLEKYNRDMEEISAADGDWQARMLDEMAATETEACPF
jgi:hypothetical protein